MTEPRRANEKVEALKRALDAFEAAQFGQLNETREALMTAAKALGWRGGVGDGDSWPWTRSYLGLGPRK